jgi:hypothetical protein
MDELLESNRGETLCEVSRENPEDQSSDKDHEGRAKPIIGPTEET